MDPARKLPPPRVVPVPRGDLQKRVECAAKSVAFDEEEEGGLSAPSCVAGNENGVPFDEAAFTAFVKTHVKRVSEHARWLHVSQDAAEDILQLALEKLYLCRGVIEPAHWEGWLRTSMLFRSMHHFRGVRRARKNELDVTLVAAELPGSASPETEAYQRECAGELLALLGGLSPERREVASLHLIDDLPLREIATRLGIPENTAKHRWRLACIDMAGAWSRGRAKERSNKRITAFFSAAAALLLAIWRRVTGLARAGGPLLACAACVLLVAGEPGESRPAPPPGVHAAVEAMETARPAAVTLAGGPVLQTGESASSHERQSGGHDERQSSSGPERHSGGRQERQPACGTGGRPGCGAPSGSANGAASPQLARVAMPAPVAVGGNNAPLPTARGVVRGVVIARASGAMAGPSVASRAFDSGEGLPAPSSSRVVPSGDQAAKGPGRSLEEERARAHNHLARVLSLHVRGETVAARELLDLYPLYFPEDPVPAQRASVAAKLGAR